MFGEHFNLLLHFKTAFRHVFFISFLIFGPMISIQNKLTEFWCYFHD